MTWRDKLPAVRGRLAFDEPLAPFTWLRVGGPADVLYLPADAADLQGFLRGLDPGVPVTVLGAASNTLVRDGGVEGVVIRLGRAFAEVRVLDPVSISAGAAALDSAVAKAAAKAGIAGLEFYIGVPGSVGGAVVMNAGCYGQETTQVLTTATVVDRRGAVSLLGHDDLGYTYRHSVLHDADLIVLSAVFEGAADDPAEVQARMDAITARREQSQPIREKTSGSTFKNPTRPDGETLSAWRCVDEAGWRGRLFTAAQGGGGGALFSPQHANFLINPGEAKAADLEGLGEAVRADVRDKLGVELEWEVKRIGRPAR